MVALPVRNTNGANFGQFLDQGTLKALTKIQNPSVLGNVLYPSQRASVVTAFFDFTDTTITSFPFTLSKDTNATSFAQVAAPGGIIRAITGTTDNDVASAFGSPVWTGAKNAGLEIRMKVSVISGLALEAGFLDALTTKTDMAVTDVDTPAFAAGVGEAALLAWNTDDTITTPRVVSDSATFTTAKGETILKQDGTAWTPTADTYFTLRISLRSATDTGSSILFAIFDENHNLVFQTTFDVIAGAGTGGLTSATALAPWLAIRTNNTTSKNFDVDYIFLWADR